jgi:hypothetical protein
MMGLTWDQLAELHDKANPNGRPARTLPFEVIFDWAERQTDKFILDSEGSIHLLKEPK